MSGIEISAKLRDIGATRGIQKLEGSVNSLATRFVGLQAAVGAVQQLMQYVVTTIKDSIQAFRSFENKMAEVSTILGDISHDMLPELSIGVESLSMKFGKSADDMASGMYQILSAAVPAADALELLNISAKASIAGLSDVKTSVDVLTSVLNSYQMTVSEMYHISDVMFQAVVRGKFTYDQLANSLGYLTPIAAQAGVSFEELAAAMATTTRHGQHIDMVARGLALGIQNIIKPSKEAKEVAARYGIDLSLVALKTKTFAEFLEELNEKTRGNASLISQIIPNMRSYRVMMVLAGNGISGFTDDMELMSASIGKTDEAFEKMASTSQMTANILDQSFAKVQRSIGRSTQELDFMWKSLEITGGSVIEDVFNKLTDPQTMYSSMFMVTPGGPKITGFSPMKFGFEALAGGMKKGGDRVSEARKLRSFYADQAKKDIESATSEAISPQKTLYDRLLGGEDVDLSKEKIAFQNLKVAAADYEDTAFRFIDATKDGEAASSDLTIELERATNRFLTSKEAMADFNSAIAQAERSVFDHAQTLMDLQLEYEQLKEEIGEVGVEMDGTLGRQLEVMIAEKKMGDITHWVNLGMKDTKYLTEALSQNFEWLDAELQGHIRTVAAYEQQEKRLNEEIEKNTNLTRMNNLEIMKIQLKGMMRRRGLTRNEQRRRRAIEIENMKLRIDSEEKTLEDINSARNSSYEEAKRFIDDYITAEEHGLWMLKDTRQEDIDNLRLLIAGKEKIFTDLKTSMNNEYELMGEAAQIYTNLIEKFYGENIPNSIEKTIGAIRDARIEQALLVNEMGGDVVVPSEYNYGSGSLNIKDRQEDVKKRFEDVLGISFGNHESGTYFANYTGLHMLHKGEQVLPKGKAGGGNTINVNIPVKIGNVSSDLDINRIASGIARAVKAEIMNADGTTKYGMR